MSDLVPLLLLWLASKARGGGSSRPNWPSAASPPPPPPPSSPLPPAAPGAAAPPSDQPNIPGAFSDTIKARDAFYGEVKKAAKQGKLIDQTRRIAREEKQLKPIVVPGKTTPAFLRFNPQMDVSVADLQKVVIRHGGKIRKDGLYGPLTAAAWQALASKRGLQPNIERLSSKIARVATKTFTTLNSPHVP